MSSIALDNAMMKPVNGSEKKPKEKPKPIENSAPGPLKDPLKDFQIPKVSVRVITCFRKQIQFKRKEMQMIEIGTLIFMTLQNFLLSRFK